MELLRTARYLRKGKILSRWTDALAHLQWDRSQFECAHGEDNCAEVGESEAEPDACLVQNFVQFGDHDAVAAEGRQGGLSEFFVGHQGRAN